MYTRAQSNPCEQVKSFKYLGTTVANLKRHTCRKEIYRKANRRWEKIIRMNLTEMGITTRNWVDSTQDSNY
jgi:hypothetical protein